MSFYEGRPKTSGYMDVHDTPTTPAGEARAKTAEFEDWSSHRKCRPVDRLLPIAGRWSDALPADVRPQALIGLFPRVANLLALQWNDLGAVLAYFDELLVDRRGHRQGFPPPVLDELLHLRNYACRPDAG